MTQIVFVVGSPSEEDVALTAIGDRRALIAGPAAKLFNRIKPKSCAGMVLTLWDKPAYEGKVDQWIHAVRDLHHTLGLIQPRIIVPLGTAALQAVMGGVGTTDQWRGYLMKPDEARPNTYRVPTQSVYKTSRKNPDGTFKYQKGDPRTITVKEEHSFPIPARVEWIIPTLDPAMVNSMIELLPVLEADLRRVERALNGTLVFPRDDYSTEIVPELANVHELAVDIENTPTEITQIALSNGVDTASVRWPSADAAKAITNATTMIGHNVAHDFMYLSRVMPHLGAIKLWCTMLAAYSLIPDGKKGLNWVTSLYLDTQRHKHLADTDFEKYNALDAQRAAVLKVILERGLRETGQLELFEQGMMKAVPTLVRMTERGIRVDRERAAEWSAQLDRDIIRYAAELEGTMGPIVDKPLKQAKFFGLKAANEEQLQKAIIGGHPHSELMKTLMLYREAAKNRRTYAAAMDVDRVHPHYLPGARDSDPGNKGIAYSGRPTARNPNIQNQPKEARRMFIADEGYTMLSFDWSQIEPRIAAALSGDQTLAADLDGDIYAAVASALQCERSTAKTVWLLSAYLGSPMTLKNKLMLAGVNTSLKEAKQFQAQLFGRYPRWYAWRERRVQEAIRTRYLSNKFGKRAPFYRVNPAKAVNFDPQSTAAGILVYSLPKVEAGVAAFGGQLLTTVHDEILMQVPIGYEEAARHNTQLVMQSEWPQIAPGFRVPVKVKVGRSWGEMEPYVKEIT